MAASGELWRLTATDVVDLLRRREVSPLELVEASAERIAATDGHLNAIPTLCIERARAHAERIMADHPETERPRGWLGGVPIAVKDLVPVEGVRTTWGSPIYADHVPPRSDLLIETLEARGAIVIGKSNTPEFGAGANTFNEVFGKTRNPWNVEKTCGGSSGGLVDGAGHRPGLARDRLRPRRQPADSRELLQRLRHAPEPRPRRPRPEAPPLRGADGGRPHGAQRAGLRPHARCHVRRPPGRPALPGGTGGQLRRRALDAAAARPHRLQPGPRPAAGGARGRRHLRARRRDSRGRRHGGRGGLPGPLRRDRCLSGSARGALRRRQGRDARDPPGRAQARDHLEHREGPRARRRQDRPGGACARRNLSAGRPLLHAPRPAGLPLRDRAALRREHALDR